MASPETQARHVFHATTTGMDRVHAWQEATREPAFVWGRYSGDFTGPVFGSLRRGFSAWLQATGLDCPITVYHDSPSADAFGMLDPAAQKVLHVHDWFSRWERNFDWAIRCTGKVVVSDNFQTAILREKFGWIPDRYIQCIQEPRLTGSAERQPGATGPRKRTGIWLQGKKWRRHGNRLRSIVDRWPEEAGELEIVSTGKNPPGWCRKANIVWSPDLPLEFALQRLFTWDSTLLIDNYSLDAPWLRRALSLGCFPLVPDGETPARTKQWLEDSAPQPYAWGDIHSAIRLLQQWRSGKDEWLPKFQQWVTSVLTRPEGEPAFPDQWLTIKNQFAGQRSPRLRKRRPYAPWYPVAWFERVQRLRAGN